MLAGGCGCSAGFREGCEQCEKQRALVVKKSVDEAWRVKAEKYGYKAPRETPPPPDPIDSCSDSTHV